jgi:hypothetical protein
VAYRARIFGDNPLYKILSDHWQNFVGAYDERFQHACGVLRGTAKRVVNRFLDCGNPTNGFARIKCSSCGAERLLHFSCKTRGCCPSCQARMAEEWARWFADELSEPVFHRQMVFTVPKILRPCFLYDRKLLTELSRAAHRAVSRFVDMTAGAGVRPAMAIVKHTFGEGVRFHPHLHALVTSGGWDRSRVWRPVPTWDQGVLRELFEIEVFRFLRKRGLLSRERMELILSWPHSGFNVHVGEAVAPDDKISLARVARYMLRASVVMSRISYDRDHATVRIDPHGPHSEDPIELDVLDFIARLSVHIPEPHERLVLYYGLYSNASRQRRVSNGRHETSACPADQFDGDESEWLKTRRTRWAQLIRKVWQEDPLLCPRCGGTMRIISFITEQGVIDKILRHIGFKHADTPPPLYHPPPQLCRSPLG